jgi:3-hydroxybutyryl-CoA dehydratase
MSYTIKDLTVGQSATYTKTITETDVYLFAGITGDFNPAHVNAEYAKTTKFKERIAHGMLTASLISPVLGNTLPGRGTIYLNQSSRFVSPVHFGDTITAHVVVKELNPEKNRVIFHTYCVNQDNKVVVDGEAEVMPPRERIE